MAPRKILVATDFTPASDLAVQRAAALAARFKSELRIVHAIPPLGLWEGMLPSRQQWNDEISARAAPSLKDRASRITAKSMAVSTGLLIGRASTAIARAAAEYEPDLVVIGARGTGRLPMKSGLGGTASKLLRTARRPLLLVRRPDVGLPQRVLAALDLADSSESVALWADRIVGGREFTVIHVFEAPYADRLRAYGVSHKAIDVYAGDRYVERQDAMRTFSASVKHR